MFKYLYSLVYKEKKIENNNIIHTLEKDIEKQSLPILQPDGTHIIVTNSYSIVKHKEIEQNKKSNGFVDQPETEEMDAEPEEKQDETETEGEPEEKQDETEKEGEPEEKQDETETEGEPEEKQDETETERESEEKEYETDTDGESEEKEYEHEEKLKQKNNVFWP